VEVYLHAFLTSALDGDDWSASHHDRFTPWEIAYNTICTWGWVGPRAGLDAVANTEIPIIAPAGNWIRPV